MDSEHVPMHQRLHEYKSSKNLCSHIQSNAINWVLICWSCIFVLLSSQFDAVLVRLTGRELLTMFARLRGIPERYIKEVVAMEIERLDLSKHADKRCGNYRYINILHRCRCVYGYSSPGCGIRLWRLLVHSPFLSSLVYIVYSNLSNTSSPSSFLPSGGNKRKLSTAIALVGNPPIVLLVSWNQPSLAFCDAKSPIYFWLLFRMSLPLEWTLPLVATSGMCWLLSPRRGVALCLLHTGKYGCGDIVV